MTSRSDLRAWQSRAVAAGGGREREAKLHRRGRLLEQRDAETPSAASACLVAPGYHVRPPQAPQAPPRRARTRPAAPPPGPCARLAQSAGCPPARARWEALPSHPARPQAGGRLAASSDSTPDPGARLLLPEGRAAGAGVRVEQRGRAGGPGGGGTGSRREARK